LFFFLNWEIQKTNKNIAKYINLTVCVVQMFFFSASDVHKKVYFF
jgi:hypothetical protein